MLEDPSGLQGRDRATALVLEFARRPEQEGSPTTRRVPVLILTGPKGCGKTALLDVLAGELRGKVPYVRINCGGMKSTTAWEVLSLLVFDLNRHAAGYRSIRFPRFITAQVAISAQIDDPVPAEAPGRARTLNQATLRARMRKALGDARQINQLRNFLADLAQDVAEVVSGVPGVATIARYAPNLVLRGLVRWRRGRRKVLGEGLDWYGSGEQAYDELVRLNRLTRADANEAEQQEATELLWAAFLADLRAAFSTRRATRNWSMNCVLLLDDVDTEHGRLLLHTLTDARRGDDDPLTVVATSAGGVVRHVAPDEEIPFAEQASYDDYLERRQGTYARDSYPVALRDLTLDEVTKMVTAVAGPWLKAPHRTVAAEVYRFTQGHPAATAVVVKAIGDNAGDVMPVKQLLASRWRGPVDQDQTTVEEQLRRELLGEPSDAVLAGLEACAAARDVEQANELTRSNLVSLPHGDAKLVPPELQVHDPDAGQMIMLPVLRHLLARRLAATPERWRAVHTWLRDNGRESDRYYHALALRDIDEVARRLEELMPDARAWFAELTSVTAASNDLDLDGVDRPQQVLVAMGRSGPAKEIVRVVAALWAANDPLSTANRADLHECAAGDLETLARRSEAALSHVHKAAEQLSAKAKEGDTPLSSRAAQRRASTRPRAQIDFTPPIPTRARRAKRIRQVAIATAVVLTVSASGVVGWHLLTRCGEGVEELGDECVGVTDGSYVFDNRFAAAAEKILAENERVDSASHVTLALLTPMIPSRHGSSTWERIRAQLEGAHVAQLRANAEGKWPKIKLVLAHPGSNQQASSDVVDRLVKLADGPENLVGVIGLVPSSRTTQAVMRALAAADLPMIGTLVTATNINNMVGPDGQVSHAEGFTRASSTTQDQITVLSDYLGTATTRRAMLVYDPDEEDLFVSSLRDDFKAIVPARANMSITVESQYDTEASLNAQLKAIMGDLCGDGAPDTILYAARAELFDELVVNVRERNCARERPITVISGSDASVLRTREDLRPNSQDDNARTVILYTPLADPDALRQDGVTEFEQLSNSFEELGFSTTDLADGWAVITHDALLAASDAVGRAAAGRGGELPSRTDVRFEIGRTDRERNQVRGAGGTFTLDAETGNVVGRRLPVIEVDENWSFTVKGIYNAGPQA
jgi:ABC-type branched-subunit amino acid transport system substrate-binding protein